MDRGHIYQNDGNRMLLALLPGTPGAVLDCGCGAGDNARLLALDGWDVTGVTIDPEERITSERFCNEVYLADLERGLPEGLRGEFDAILMSHVLEHLARPGRLLLEARTRLSRNGVIAVALPNVLHYRQRLRFLRGTFDYTETGPLDRTHLRFYTFTTARQLLEAHGFRITKAVADGAIPWWRFRRVIPPVVRGRFDRAALRRWPNLFAHQSLFVAVIG